jgi:hypothetical protein
LSKPLELLLQRLFLLLKFSLTTRTLGEPAVQFATQPGEFFFGATMGGFQLVAPRLKAGEVCRVLGLLFGESPLSVCQFFRPAPKLFLQRFADLLDFLEPALALAKRFSIRGKTLMPFRDLSRPFLCLSLGFRQLSGPGFERSRTSIDFVFLRGQAALYLMELLQGRFKIAATFLELTTLLGLGQSFLIEGGTLLLHLRDALAQVAFGVVDSCLPFDQQLLFAADLFAHSLQLGPQPCHHGLLTFEPRDALLKLGHDGFMVSLLTRELAGLVAQFLSTLVEFTNMFLQFTARPLQLLGSLIHFSGAFRKLLLPLLDCGLQAIKADKIGLVLLLIRFQGGTFALQLPIALFECGNRFAERSLPFGQLFSKFLQFAVPCLGFSQPGMRFLLAFPALKCFLIKLPFALLHVVGRTPHRLLQAGQAITPFAVTVVKLLADLSHFLADGVDLLLLLSEFLFASLQVLALLLQRLFTFTKAPFAGRRNRGRRLGNTGLGGPWGHGGWLGGCFDMNEDFDMADVHTIAGNECCRGQRLTVDQQGRYG